MARTTRLIRETSEPDAVDDVLAEETTRAAGQLGDALDSLSEFASEGTSFKVFKLPSFQWCKDLDPPLDSSTLLEEMREEFGAGNYCIRVYMTGRKGCAAQRNFSIAPFRKVATPPVTSDAITVKDLLPLLLERHAPAAPAFDIGAFMAAQTASADRQMNMMATMTTAMMTALTGGRESPTALLSAIAPFINRPPSGAEEFATTFQLVKGLLPAPAGGGEEDSIAGLVVKGLSPVLPDIAKGFTDLAAGFRQNVAERQGAAVVETPVDYTRAAAPAATLTAEGRFPLLAALRADVLFYFERRLDPEIAADGLWAVLTSERFAAAGFKEDDLVPIVATLNAAGPAWLGELVREGIDLRADPAWAQRLLNALIAIYRGDVDDSGGDGGGEGDAHGHGGAGQVGKPANADQEPGPTADARAAV
jgi:hypothetical protein